MSDHRLSESRLDELLAGEAAGGLDADEQRELDRLLAQDGIPERDAFLRLAGLLQTSFLHQDRRGLEAMPATLRERLLQQANEQLRGSRAGNDAELARPDLRNAQAMAAQTGGRGESREQRLRRPRRWLGSGTAGWLLAACLALAFVVLRPATDAQAPDIGRLLAEADTQVLPWRQPDAPGFERVRGEVIWNDRLQAGYLRLAGMPANDPAREQYQLWIVDPDRDEHPVDGGVFDIPPGSNEVLVRIDAKLPVDQPVAFAITKERPGGVVVSDGPLLVVAAAG